MAAANRGETCGASSRSGGKFTVYPKALGGILLGRLGIGTLGRLDAVVDTQNGIPFFARLVEASLREVAPGKVEAARAMGAGTRQIVRTVLLPEARPGLIAAGTVTLIALISYSAMAGAIGGGGLGDFAIRYGYQRFDTAVTLACVVVLLVMVQLLQSAGDRVARRLAHR